MIKEAIETATPTIGDKLIERAPYVASVVPVAIGTSHSASEIAAYGGLLLAFLTFIISSYLNYRRTRAVEKIAESKAKHRRDDIPDALEKINDLTE